MKYDVYQNSNNRNYHQIEMDKLEEDRNGLKLFSFSVFVVCNV